MNNVKKFLEKSLLQKDKKIEKKTNKFEVLDGYRGFLANLVVIQHIFNTLGKQVQPRGDYDIFHGAGYYIGVSGFFVLSAFLLTYRLLTEFDESNNSNRIILLRTMQYSIRRFFRIYLVFVCFYALISFGPVIFRAYFSIWSPFTDALLLRSVGFNHIWTIPCEIKYYFCIPLICYVFHKSGKYWPVMWILSLVLTFYVGYFNPFDIKAIYFYDLTKGNILSTRVTVFLAGSLIGIAYFNLKKQRKILQYIEDSIILQRFLSCILIILFVLQFKYFSVGWNAKVTLTSHTISSGFYQAILLFFLLFNTQNYVTGFYSWSYFESSGKYSFGMYLFHATCISIYMKHPIAVRFIFEVIMTIVLGSYLAGVIWFHVLEKHLMSFANYLCKKLGALEFFSK